MIKRKIAEYRTLSTNEKGLEEKRTDLLLEMNKIVEGAKAETRTLTDEEETRFNDIKKEIRKIDTTLAAIEEETRMQVKNPIKGNKGDNEKLTTAQQEERAFENFLRDKQEEISQKIVNVFDGNFKKCNTKCNTNKKQVSV